MTDSFLLFGIESLTGGRRAFLNFTRNLLLQEVANFLPPDQVVIEVLEDVQPTPEVVSACAELKRRGYMIALDDCVVAEESNPLVGLADIVKVDFLATAPEMRREMAQRYVPLGITMLAEKVESHDHFREASDAGYTYFQGYFFCKPEILSGRDIRGFKLNYLNLLQAISGPDPDFADVEKVIKRDTSLCYKLLRYLNSAAFGLRREITSIRHALSLLGIQEVRRWTSLVALAGLVSGKPAELMVTSMVRARFCENLARPAGQASRSTELFLVGLLSVMDAILDRTMESVLDALPLSSEVKSALLRQENVLSHFRMLVLAHEKGEWHQVSALAEKLGLSEPDIALAYLECVTWTQKIFQLSVPTSATAARSY